MTITCSRCSRTNPPEAQFCYFDGVVLSGQSRNGPLHMGTQPFPRPFVFPSGRQCQNFDQLALACQDDGLTAIKLLQSGDLPSFLSSIGRSDLALAAREVMKAPNKAIGFDGFLAALPSTVLQPPTLAIEPKEINLGDLQIGQDRKLSLRLINQGMRLVHGNVYSEDAPWLSIGDATGVQEKLFQFSGEQELHVHVRGDKLTASPKPVEARLRFRSSGGDATVLLRANIPIRPFVEGILKDCSSPRQVAEKARTNPREAAEFFENGAVEKWYKSNGWSYPVKGASSTGLGAIQQFFEALGLAKAPKVELSIRQVFLQGKPGEALRQVIEVRTQEKRNVFAVAHSSQPWLKVECEPSKGQTAQVALIVPQVPDRPGETLEAKVQIQSNGNQRFELPVRLVIAGTPRPKTPPARSPHVFVPLPAAPFVVPPSGGQPQAPFVVPPLGGEPQALAPAADTEEDWESAPAAIPMAPLPPAPITPAAAAPLPQTAVEEEHEEDGGGVPRWLVHIAPLALLTMLLICCLPIHDFFFVKALVSPNPDDEKEVIDPDPLVAIKMHSRKGIDLASGEDDPIKFPSQRFGLVMTRERDPGDRSKYKRLTYDQNGRSNNTVIRYDGHEVMFGNVGDRGTGWIEPLKELGKDEDRERLSGYRSIWAVLDEKVPITQTVELVAGGPAPGGNIRYYDTCLVTYKIENKDSEPHKVGLRFMLDTFIGGNDGVPFTLPGSNELCDTSRDLDEIPDYIEAREKADFNKPGTIARLQLRLGKRVETPNRVTLGAWPNGQLSAKDKRCKAQLTMWEVPVLPIKAIQEVVGPGESADSCVVMYWPEKEIAPGKSRELAFAYGLGNLASDKEGKLGLTVPPSAVKGVEFTVTALVKSPVKGQTVTLKLPKGLDLRSADAEQVVPRLPENSDKKDSPVTWKVRANDSGTFEIEVKSSTGGSVTKKIKIKDKDIFN